MHVYNILLAKFRVQLDSGCWVQGTAGFFLLGQLEVKFICRNISQNLKNQCE